MAETDLLRLRAEARQRQARAQATLQQQANAAPQPAPQDDFDPLVPRHYDVGPGATGDWSGEQPSRMREFGGPSMAAAGDYASSLMGGEGITVQSIPQSVKIYSDDGPSVEIPNALRHTAGRAADMAMVPISALAGVAAGGAGLVGDAAESAGMPSNRADALARDLAAMPEAFAGSPTTLAAPTSTIPRPAPVRRAPGPNPNDPTDVGRTIRNAANNDRANGATRKAAENMAVNPDAAAAAERLGVDLPADVFSDSAMVREAAGMTRSIAGSEASAQFRDAVMAASDKADEAMRMIGGDSDISLASANVRSTLNEARDGLEAQADTLYTAVNDRIPNSTVIEPVNMRATFNEIVEELGGTEGMTPAERSLRELLESNQGITYARLMREKRLIGRALARQSSPYSDADERLLSRVYAAISDDQLDNVERIGGAELRADLEAANRLHAQRRDLEDQITSAFGKDQERSIVPILRQSITQGAQGNVSQLNRVMSVVPADLRAEVLATAITSVSTTNRATGPNFDFAKFAKLHEGLRRNTQVYDRIRTTLGPEATQTMSDLAEVSRRVTEARASVVTTGKSNQALLRSMTAEGIVSRVMNTTAGRGMTRAVGATAGGAAGGPVGAVGGAQIGENIIGAMSRGEAARVAAAGRLFSSPEFQRMAIEAARTGRVAQETVDAVSRSAAFRAWAQRTGLSSPAPWLASAVLAAEQDQWNEDESVN